MYIAMRVGNSYTLTTLEGFPLNSQFHARCLCRFIPRDGTALAALQSIIHERDTETGGIMENSSEMEIDDDQEGDSGEEEEDSSEEEEGGSGEGHSN